MTSPPQSWWWRHYVCAAAWGNKRILTNFPMLDFTVVELEWINDEFYFEYGTPLGGFSCKNDIKWWQMKHEQRAKIKLLEREKWREWQENKK